MNFFRYRQPKMPVVLLLGFASGLPLALTGSTLKAWLQDRGVEIGTIGFFSYLSLPYSLKFLWAPLIDRLRLPWLTRRFGQRVGWLIVSQTGLAAALWMLAGTDPAVALAPVALLALAVAFFSASQDVVIDAYRTEYLSPEDYGDGAATAVFGYRFGMLAAGAGALFLADHVAWATVYRAMAGLSLIGLATGILAGEPAAPPREPKDGAPWLKQAFIAPFRQFAQAHRSWLALLCLIALYRLPESFVGSLLITFERSIGFSKSEIAAIVKLFGFAATILGAYLGSFCLKRWGMWRSLWWLGLLQGPSNLCLLLLYHTGAVSWALAVVVGAENLIAGALGTLAAAFLMSLCDRRYTATQYALLSALAALSTGLLAGPAGIIVAHFGYPGLFWLSLPLGLPGIALLLRLRGHPAFDLTPRAGGLPSSENAEKAFPPSMESPGSPQDQRPGEDRKS